MSTDAVGSATSTTAATSSATSSSSGLGQNDFLLLLMTQLKNQDPTSPTDTNTFVTEMCQLTSTQAITNMQANIESLASAVGQGNMGQWASTIGAHMMVGSANTVSIGDKVVLLPGSEYDSLSLTLKDSSGNQTTQTFSADDSPVFTDSDGRYTIVSAMATKDGVPTACSYAVYRLIAGVESTDSGPALVASDGTTYLASGVTQIIN